MVPVPERTVEAVTSYYAVAEGWSGGSYDLWVYPEDSDVSVFGDLERARGPADVPAAATARLQVAGWKITGEWVVATGPLGARWQALVEPAR